MLHDMKATRRAVGTLLGSLLAIGAVLAATGLRAQTATGQVQVRGLIGAATYSAAGSGAMALQAGTSIPVGAVVKTEAGAAVDLAFSHSAGVVRLLQSSTLSLDKFTTDATPGAGTEIQL